MVIIWLTKMSEEDFMVHVISNVSPDIFPNNNPSEFSTILANDITLNEDNWEVAVRQIMYPTHVATTSKDDKISIHKYGNTYRNLLPCPKTGAKDVSQLGAMIDFDSFKFKPTVVAAPTSSSSSNTSTKEEVKTSTIVDAATASKKRKLSKEDEEKEKEKKRLEEKKRKEAQLKEKRRKAKEAEEKRKQENLQTAKAMVEYVNNTVWSKDKGIIQLNYREDHNKFILHIYENDIVVTFTEHMRRCFGFKTSNFMRGTHWAWYGFDYTYLKQLKKKKAIYLSDLRTLEREQHVLLFSHNNVNNHRIFVKTIPNKFKDTLPDEYTEEPKFSFGVYPNEGRIRLKTIKPIPSQHKSHEIVPVFIRFDENTRSILKMPGAYGIADQDEFKFPTVPVKTSSYGANDYHPFDKLISIGVEIFYSTMQENLIRDVLEKPEEIITVAADKEIHNPNEMLQHLNKKSNCYKFTYEKTEKRFHLHVKKNSIIKMSKSLSSVLGFTETDAFYHGNDYYRANQFPIFNRAITALYVYTNIIEPTFIGNVKAPLLLTCPFKKLDNNIVNEQEFLNPNYNKLNRKVLRQIDIGIYDDSGVLVPFLHGKTKLSLHFRRKKY